MTRSRLLRLAAELDDAVPRLDVLRQTRALLRLWREGSMMRERLEFDEEAGAPTEYVRAVRVAADYCAGPASVSPRTEVAVVRGLLPWPCGGEGER